MPVNKIAPSNRARSAIASVIAAMLIAATSLFPSSPPAVALAVDHLIKPWEGLVLTSHWDRYAKIWDICYGETKGITAGMTKTKAECERMLAVRVERDYFAPLLKCVPGLSTAPISVQASLLSGAYNFGVGAACRSTAAKMVTARRYRDACIAQTAFNRAGGQVVNGLVKRREMGDSQRIGEAELCVSGL
ncbi:glycoside hydrolase [Aureimonas sp. Leaf454]|uniref:lysozyme n=1 Tax=Aureimonas sp. Leaf454 TaxID=1736381 RepID=UPI0006F2816C|nr:lysozyme [Aureimonas sp. Leaf454]KQT54614.1 glycoside hydrolase [Aureimonas sp. Leaf454]